MKAIYSAVIIFCSLASGGYGQQEGTQKWGLNIAPEISARGVYDNRVISGDAPEADLYVEPRASVRISNLPARYNFLVDAGYGYRLHNEYTRFDDDFYNLGAAIRSSAENPLVWGLSADASKSLGYNTDVNLEDGQFPDPIIDNSPGHRYVVQGSVTYEKSLSEDVFIRPEYSLTHNYQDGIAGSGTAEWQIHTAAVQLRRAYSERTIFFSEVSYALQQNDDENGFVGMVIAGAEYELSEKVEWIGSVGYAHADYEQSGVGHGLVASIRGNWRLTDKLAIYIFGGNDFQPGYDGGAARWVYRVGYGASWQALEKLAIQASMLHDYVDLIGDNTSSDPVNGELRSFFDASANYQFTDHFSGALGYRLVSDEDPTAQQVAFLQLNYQF